MRAHGWGGDPPADAEQARARIVAATIRCIELFGPEKTHLADVATELGVTRQTVYRYFTDTEDLLSATAIHAAGAFLDRVVEHSSTMDGAAEMVIEAFAYTLEGLPGERYLTLLLTRGATSKFTQGVTSPTTVELGRSVIDRLPIDWAGGGFTEEDRNDLVELMLRVLLSFVLHPGDRSGPRLRAFLRRWLAPALDSVPVLRRHVDRVPAPDRSTTKRRRAAGAVRRSPR